MILAATCGGGAFLLFIAMIMFFVRKKILKQKRGNLVGTFKLSVFDIVCYV